MAKRHQHNRQKVEASEASSNTAEAYSSAPACAHVSPPACTHAKASFDEGSSLALVCLVASEQHRGDVSAGRAVAVVSVPAKPKWKYATDF